MTINLLEKVKIVLSVLEQNGFEAYCVGGCVRDSILDKIPHDYDITTNALPEQIQKCFQGYKVIETGLKHGTLTVMIDSMPIEITTFRVDGIYSDNRHPDTVRFVSNLKEDLSRRDFTINAMAYSPVYGLIDYFDGCSDLHFKKIKCVGDANKRFNEDALRILRAMRFASTYGFSIEQNTSKAIHENKGLLNNIAKERINTELSKLVCGNGVENALKNYSDVISVFIPEIKPAIGFKQNNPYHTLDVWEHTVKSVGASPNELIIRLSMLLHDIGKPECYTLDESGTGHFYEHAEISSDIAVEILNRLRYDNYTIMRVRDLISVHDLEIGDSKKSVRKFLNKIGEENLRSLLKVKKADIAAQNPIYYQDRHDKLVKIESILNDIINTKECFSKKDLSINGADLISMGIPEGKQIGIIIDDLLETVLDNPALNKKEILINIVCEKYQ